MSSVEGVLLASKDTLSPARLLFWWPIDLNVASTAATAGATHAPLSRQYRPLLLQGLVQRTGMPDATSMGDSNELGCSHRMLADTLIPSADTLGSRMELKIDNHIFVGHPIRGAHLRRSKTNDEIRTGCIYNIIFILSDNVTRAGIDCFYDLARRLSAALQHEEPYTGYTSFHPCNVYA